MRFQPDDRVAGLPSLPHRLARSNSAHRRASSHRSAQFAAVIFMGRTPRGNDAASGLIPFMRDLKFSRE